MGIGIVDCRLPIFDFGLKRARALFRFKIQESKIQNCLTYRAVIQDSKFKIQESKT